MTVFMDEPSKLTRDLREQLDKRGIDWWDETSEDDVIHTERTKWTNPRGNTTSVIYGYARTSDYVTPDERFWYTFGAPEMLECWPDSGAAGDDPVGMTIDEIIKECC